MPKSLILKSQINKINKLVEGFIDKYLILCESEIEKIFITNLIYYLFEMKFNITRETDSELNYTFSNFTPYTVGVFDDNYNNYKSPELFDGDGTFKLVGIQMNESYSIVVGGEIGVDKIKNKYIFIPQYPVSIGDRNYRLDVGLICQHIKNGKIVKEIFIDIECDGFDYHSSKEQLTRDSQRTRKLMNNGWHVLRYTGSEIVGKQDITDIHRLMNEIFSIVKNNIDK